jgi:hypothetical protein
MEQGIALTYPWIEAQVRKARRRVHLEAILMLPVVV